MLINTADAEAENKMFEGKAIAYESIGDTGCPIDPDPNCKPGEPCRVDLVLEGNVAARLYDILARHGVQKDDEMAELVGGSYTQTSDGLIVCVEHDGERTCNLGYDAIKNRLDYVPRACE
jgi:hypothetical protein